MKKILCILLVLGIFLLSGCSKKEIPTNYNASIVDNTITKYPWLFPAEIVFGMPKSALLLTLQNTKGHLVNDSGIKDLQTAVVFGRNESFRNCTVLESYTFSDAEFLETFSYTFHNQANNHPHEYFGIYTELKSMLKKEYGEPIVCNERWLNENNKGKINLNDAIISGDYISESIWHYENFGIALGMNFNKNDYITLIYYAR